MEVKTLINQVKKQCWPSGHYAVFGSAVMAVKGLREAPNIDVIADNFLWDRLLEDRYIPNSEGFIRIGSIKISNWWFAPTRKDIPTMISEAKSIDGVPFVDINEVLFYKKTLPGEKERNDIELIRSFLTGSKVDMPVNLGMEIYDAFLKIFVVEVSEKLGDKILSMVVFGSVSRGQAKGDSDIDMFVFYDDKKVGLEEVESVFNEVVVELRNSDEYGKLLNRGIFPEIYPFLISRSKARDILWVSLDATEDGVIIKDVNGFGREVMRGIGSKVGQMGGRRVKFASGGWCWMLFKDYSYVDKNIIF